MGAEKNSGKNFIVYLVGYVWRKKIGGSFASIKSYVWVSLRALFGGRNNLLIFKVVERYFYKFLKLLSKREYFNGLGRYKPFWV